jgi:hypothetical protein
MTKAEMLLAAELLDMAANEFGNHGCNDFNMFPHLPDRAVRDALVRSVLDGEDYYENRAEAEAKGRDYRMGDASLMHAMAKALREAA